jgi:hypothetical protein
MLRRRCCDGFEDRLVPLLQVRVFDHDQSAIRWWHRALCASLSSQARHFAGGYRWEDIARQQEAVYRSSLAAPEN